MKLLYFAWVRERIGKAEEELSPPEDVKTVAELMAWLSAKGDNYAAAFSNMKTIRAALDRTHAMHESAIADAREIRKTSLLFACERSVHGLWGEDPREETLLWTMLFGSKSRVSGVSR